MKRALVFLLLEPVFGAWLHFVAAGGKLSGVFTEAGVMALLLSLVISAVTGPVDEILSHTLPISLRALLIAVGPILAVGGKMISAVVLIAFAASGALGAGACSLLSHNYRGHTTDPAGSSG
jgi:hypothetical protein